MRTVEGGKRKGEGGRRAATGEAAAENKECIGEAAGAHGQVERGRSREAAGRAPNTRGQSHAQSSKSCPLALSRSLQVIRRHCTHLQGSPSPPAPWLGRSVPHPALHPCIHASTHPRIHSILSTMLLTSLGMWCLLVKKCSPLESRTRIGTITHLVGTFGRKQKITI
jgi:hypothetical protein